MMLVTSHQSGCFPLPKEEPLSTCFPQLPVFRNVFIGRSYISDQVVAPSRSWSASMSFMSTGHPFCDLIIHLLLRLPAMCSAQLRLLSLYVPDNVCHTTLFADLVCTLSVLEGDSYHDSLCLPLGYDQFLKFGVAKRSGLSSHMSLLGVYIH